MRSKTQTREILNGEDSARYGVIVSFSSDDGDHTTIHMAAGSQTEALRRCCEWIDRLDGRWYIDAISTPQSIYHDLTGVSHGDAGDRRGTLYRERQFLARVGRLDLLRVPRLNPERDSTKRSGHGWRRVYGL